MSNDTTTRIGRRHFLNTLGAAGAASLVAPAVLRAQSHEVKVGYILPVTGPLAFEAQLALNGLQLAVDEINGAGGVKSLGGAQAHAAARRHPEQGRAGQLRGGAPDRSGRGRRHRALLEPGGLLGPPGDREEQDAVPAPGHRRRQPHRGRAALHLPRCSPTARAMATLTVANMLEMAKTANIPDQAGGHHARGRQLRHHDGQPRGGLRREAWATSWCSACPTTCARPTSPPSCPRSRPRGRTSW